MAEDEQTVKPVLKIPTREELARIVANFADSQDVRIGLMGKKCISVVVINSVGRLRLFCRSSS